MKRIVVLLFAVAMVSSVVVARAETSTPTKRTSSQPDRGPPASGGTGSLHRLDPVPGGELAHRTGVRERRTQRISTSWTSAHPVDDLPWLWADFEQ